MDSGSIIQSEYRISFPGFVIFYCYFKRIGLSAGSASLPRPCTGKCSAGRHPIIKELIVVTYEFDFDFVEPYHLARSV